MLFFEDFGWFVFLAAIALMRDLPDHLKGFLVGLRARVGEIHAAHTHREIKHSDDLELIEITSPAEFETISLNKS